MEKILTGEKKMEIDMDNNGSFEVISDPILYGVEQVTLDYWIHTKINPEDLSKTLSFIQKYYRQAYDQVLDGVFSAYKNSPNWDVWVDDAKKFLRIDFAQKEELHAYIGMPIVDLFPIRPEMVGLLLYGWKYAGNSCLSMS